MFTLPELLRTVRELKGFSARSLSLKAGLSDAYVGKIEGQVLEPSLRSFVAIMAALDLTGPELLLFLHVAHAHYFPPIAT